MDDWDVELFTPEVERQFRELEAQGLLPREINRFGDHYLKFLLAEPKRKPLLLDLTNSILQSMGYEPLEDLEPMDRELSPLIAGGRGLRLDYLGRTPSGRMINLEFQKHGDGDFIKRALFCTSAISKRSGSGGRSSFAQRRAHWPPRDPPWN
jgi:hypothetical protein